jgi:hypothetical protein
MNVFVPFDECSEKVVIDRAEDCGEGPIIHYTLFARCVACDAAVPAFRLLVLDKDLRPVIAVRDDRRGGMCVPN